MADKIVLSNIGKSYKTGKGNITEALQDISFTVGEGEFVCIIGPSGCGKSTLLRILAGIFRQSTGEIIIHRSSEKKRPLNAMVFQEYAMFQWRTVLDNVLFGLEMQGVSQKERSDIGMKHLNRVGLTPYADHYPYQLSGGMKQRVAIARALASDPEVLLMDEPFGALDAQTRTIMQEELLKIWNEEKKTVVYVTHSIEEAVMLGDRVVLLSARPGQVKHIWTVDLPRPRALTMRTSVEFNTIAQPMWDDLVEEVNKSRLSEEKEAL